MRSLTCSLVAAFIVSGCISSSRTSEPKDASETALTDADVAAGDAADGATTTTDATGQVDVTWSFDADVGVGCRVADDCRDGRPSGPCQQPLCDGGRCTVVERPDDFPCDDGDACTEDTICRSGVCTGGGAVKCPVGDDPCVEAACDPSTGCGARPTPAGTPCDNGQGLPPGTCAAYTQFQPSDRCDGAGACEDALVEPITEGLDAAGDWFVVGSSAQAGFNLTFTGRLTMHVDGTFTTESFRASSGFFDTGGPVEGDWCAGDDGRFEVHIRDTAYRGVHDADAEHASVLADAGLQIAWLTRVHHGVEDVDGTYRMIGTAPHWLRPLDVETAMFVFDDGCVEGIEAVQPAYGDPYELRVPADEACLAVSNQVATLTLERAAVSGQTTVAAPWELVGAIGPGGDVLAMSVVDVSGKPTFGTKLFVRVDDDVERDDLDGDWFYARHGTRSTDDHGLRAETGDLAFDGALGEVSGGYTRVDVPVAADFTGGWFRLSGEGGASVGLEEPSASHGLSGVLRTRGVGVLYGVTPSDTGPRVLGSLPTYGAFVPMVRRP